MALEKGAGAAVDQLGQRDGFLGSDRFRIPLPGVLEQAAKLLRNTGQRDKVDALIEGMNRAAEQAVPEARQMLVSAARSLSASDAVAIVRGGETSVTDFFAQRTRGPLTDRFLPIVTRHTERLALAERYNAVAGKASQLGLVKGDGANLQRHVTAKALDALYTVIGEQERKFRQDPVGTGSAILRKVFGG